MLCSLLFYFWKLLELSLEARAPQRFLLGGWCWWTVAWIWSCMCFAEFADGPIRGGSGHLVGRLGLLERMFPNVWRGCVILPQTLSQFQVRPWRFYCDSCMKVWKMRFHTANILLLVDSLKKNAAKLYSPSFNAKNRLQVFMLVLLQI